MPIQAPPRKRFEFADTLDEFLRARGWRLSEELDGNRLRRDVESFDIETSGRSATLHISRVLLNCWERGDELEAQLNTVLDIAASSASVLVCTEKVEMLE